jgi:RNA polymerase sigma-70 factor (ECF subfamily)
VSDDKTFADLLRRIRAGDPEAASELIRKFEPAIRMEAKLRLRDPRLRRVVDSMDICQSVLASFFVKAASGGYDLDSPERLIALLVTIARRKVAYHARRHKAQRRDQQREEPLNLVSPEPISAGPSPSRLVAGRELLDEFRRRLSSEERSLADMRTQGYEWAEIAAHLGGTPQARRKQLARATDRVTQELRLEGTDDG